MRTHYFKDLKGFVASPESVCDNVIYTLKEHNSVMCQIAELKNKLEISKRNSKYTYQELDRVKNNNEYHAIELNKAKDKLHRRNKQIKDLKLDLVNATNGGNCKCDKCGKYFWAIKSTYHRSRTKNICAQFIA